jgi:hypothetical protein
MKTISIFLKPNDQPIGAAEDIIPIKETNKPLFRLPRVRLDRDKIDNLFISGSRFLVQSQKNPLQIDVSSDDDFYKLKNAWLISTEHTYMTDKFIIITEAIIEAEEIRIIKNAITNR